MLYLPVLSFPAIFLLNDWSEAASVMPEPISLLFLSAQPWRLADPCNVHVPGAMSESLLFVTLFSSEAALLRLYFLSIAARAISAGVFQSTSQTLRCIK